MRFLKKVLAFSQLRLYNHECSAGMAELADAHGSGPCESNFMEVRLLLPAPQNKTGPSWSGFVLSWRSRRRRTCEGASVGRRSGGPSSSERAAAGVGPQGRAATAADSSYLHHYRLIRTSSSLTECSDFSYISILQIRKNSIFQKNEFYITHPGRKTGCVFLWNWREKNG